MKRIALILVMFIRIATLAFCEIDIPEGAELTDTKLWTPFVDILRIRETPDLNGKVIATIKLGEPVEYIETSKNTSTVDYNGEKITAAWIKVKMIDGRIGWGWKGFMVGLKKYWDKRFGFEMIIPDTDVISLRISREEIDPGYYGAPFAIDWKFDEKTKVKFVYADPGDQDFTFYKRYYPSRVYDSLYSIQIEPQNRLKAASGLPQYFMEYCISGDDFESKLLNKISNVEKKYILEFFKLENFKYYCFNERSEEISKVLDIIKEHQSYYYNEIIKNINKGDKWPCFVGTYFNSFYRDLNISEQEIISRNIKEKSVPVYIFPPFAILKNESDYIKIQEIFSKYNYIPQIYLDDIPPGVYFHWLLIDNSKKYRYKTTVNNYLSDLKNNKGSYYAKKWYGSSEILFRSVKIYK